MDENKLVCVIMVYDNDCYLPAFIFTQECLEKQKRKFKVVSFKFF